MLLWYRFANQWHYVILITAFTMCSLDLIVNSQVCRVDYICFIRMLLETLGLSLHFSFPDPVKSVSILYSFSTFQPFVHYTEIHTYVP